MYITCASKPTTTIVGIMTTDKFYMMKSSYCSSHPTLSHRQQFCCGNRVVPIMIVATTILHLIMTMMMMMMMIVPWTFVASHEHQQPYEQERRTRRIPSRDDYIVHGLEDVVSDFKNFDGIMYSGLIPTTLYDSVDNDNNNNNGELMFWLFAPNQPIYTDTLLIWLNGGPGCSSFGGMMFENGPVTIGRYKAGYYGIDPQVPLQYNPYTWTNVTAIMYVEQPQGGTGFSQTGSIPNNETDVSRDFYYFLQNFYTIFGNTKFDSSSDENWLAKKLTFFGESYAGMFVPSIAHYIHKENKKQQHMNEQQQKQQRPSHHIIPLYGIALGNGWMDAQIQGPAVIDYAWWHGMIDTSTMKAMKNEWYNCRPDRTSTTTSEQKQHYHHPFHAFTIPDECGIMGAVLDAAGRGIVDWGTPNAYDVTTWDPYLMLDIPSGSINQFYNNPLVQKALNVVPPRPWVECMPGAGRRRRSRSRQLSKMKLPGQLLLEHDQPMSVVPYVAELLDDAKINVLIYNGDRDMTTNSQGSEMLLDNMIWSGASGWADTRLFDRGVWLPKVGKKLGGYIKQYQNLQFLVVYNSGHLVPFNRDEIAYELVSRFLGNISFMDKALPKFHIHRDHVAQPSTTSGSGTKYRNNNDDSKSNIVYDFGSVLVYTVIGFVVGFYVSRKIQKGRGLYQSITSI